jgi:RHS repeat-associated protein
MGTGGTRYTYDLAGRLTLESFADGRSVAYAYDKVGNRLTRTEKASQAAPAQVTAYEYNSNDWLLTETRPDGSATSYDYDANGALVFESTSSGGNNVRRVTREFTFDGKVSAQREYVPGSLMFPTSVTEYDYDGDGNRVGVERRTYNPGNGQQVSENATYYMVDTSQPYAEVIQEWERVGTGAPVLSARYDIGLDQLRMLRANPSNAPPGGGTSGWYVFDGLGSTRALLDDSGNGTDLWGYQDAFGIPQRLYPAVGSGLPGSPNAFFLNGQQWDSGEGLYFNRARYYQPSLGRFIGEDPILGKNYEPITLNRYLYAHKDPVNITDASGKDGQGGIGGTGVTSAISARLNSLVISGLIQVLKLSAKYPKVFYSLSLLNAATSLDAASKDPHAAYMAMMTGGLADDFMLLQRGAQQLAKNIALSSETLLQNKSLWSNTPVTWGVGSGAVLEKEMVRAGLPKPSFPSASHHAVAGNVNIPELQEARKKLVQYGIYANHPANGVYLPTDIIEMLERIERGETIETPHVGSHMYDYHRFVGTFVSESTSREDAIIRIQICVGLLQVRVLRLNEVDALGK